MALYLVNFFQKLRKFFKRPANRTSGITFYAKKCFTLGCTLLKVGLSPSKKVVLFALLKAL